MNKVDLVEEVAKSVINLKQLYSEEKLIRIKKKDKTNDNYNRYCLRKA